MCLSDLIWVGVFDILIHKILRHDFVAFFFFFFFNVCIYVYRYLS